MSKKGRPLCRTLATAIVLLGAAPAFAQQAATPAPIVRPAPEPLSPRLLPVDPDHDARSTSQNPALPPPKSFTAPSSLPTSGSNQPIRFNDLRSKTNPSESGVVVQTGDAVNDAQPLPPRQAARSAWDTQPLPPRSGSNPEPEYLDSLDSPNPTEPQEPLRAMSPDQLMAPAWSGASVRPAASPAIASGFPQSPSQPPAGQGFDAQEAPSIPASASLTVPAQTESIQRGSANGAEQPHSVLISGGVQTASFNQLAALDERNLANQIAMAKQLVQRYSVQQATSPLPGQPITLRELLQRTPAQFRKAMISQYWETYYDWTALQTVREYDQWLQRLTASTVDAERSLLNAARMEAQDQVLANEIQLRKSQSRLRELAQYPSGLPLLPSDLPLVKNYQTHYDWYARRNLVPTNLLGIDRVLPRSLELIARRADTARAARAAMNQARNAVANGQTNLGTALVAARLWKDATGKLFGTITRYNQAIADYALSINPIHRTPDQIVAMLIVPPSATPIQRPAAGQPLPTIPVRSADRRLAPTHSGGFDSPSGFNPVRPDGQTRPPNASFNLSPETPSQHPSFQPSGFAPVGGNSQAVPPPKQSPNAFGQR